MGDINHRAWALTGALALGLALVSGCGDDDKDKDTTTAADTAKDTGASTSSEKPKAEPYSQSAMESKLEDTLGGGSAPSAPSTPGVPPTPAGPKVTSVKCPSDVRPGKGTAFDCKASGKGINGTVRVTLKSENLTPFSYKGKLGDSGVTTTLSGTVN